MRPRTLLLQLHRWAAGTSEFKPLTFFNPTAVPQLLIVAVVHVYSPPDCVASDRQRAVMVYVPDRDSTHSPKCCAASAGTAGDVAKTTVDSLLTLYNLVTV